MTQQDIRHSIGHRLKALREKHGLTQEEVARRAKCSLHYVQILEGKEPSSVSVVTLEKIAQAFDLPLWKFLKFEE
jgi:transcriptional regulator with XRE-family HTH domain